MKSKQSHLVVLTVFAIAGVFLALLLVYNFLLSLHVALLVKILVFIIAFLLGFGLIYSLLYQVLHPMFKSNATLELLLKDTLHELNIPLSVIKANLQMLRIDEKDTKRLKRLERIDLASNDLNRLYKDLDYYIKREVRFDLKEEFDVSKLIKEYVQRLEHVENKIHLDLESLHVYADRQGFMKSLGNLLSNACKYTSKEKNVYITLKNGKLIIEDEGRGMSQTELFRIFDRYYQAESTNEGHGIGLNIVKNYCDEQKIFINIHSKPHAGTKVILDLNNICIKEKGE